MKLSERRRSVRDVSENGLTHLGAVFPKKAVGKNGQPPLWVRVASLRMQFEWYRGRFALSSQKETKALYFL